MGEDRQFLRGVGAVNVHRGVGFGESLGLGELEHLGVVGTILLHPRQDEVARAVQDAADRVDAVGCEALADGGHNRNAAGHGRLEGDRAAQLAGQLEEFRAMLCQQCLVGGDHILPVLEQLDHHRTGRLQSPDKQNRHGDRWIPRDVADIGRDLPARHLHATVLGNVLDDGPFDDDRSAGVPRDMVGRLDEQADNARSNGAQADDADTDWCAHGGNDSKNRAGRTSDGNEPTLRLEARHVVRRAGSGCAGRDEGAGGVETPFPGPLLALRAWMKNGPSHASPTRKRGNPGLGPQASCPIFHGSRTTPPLSPN